MDKLQEIRRGRTCVFALHAHLVFVTKYRRNVLDDAGVRGAAPHLREGLRGLRGAVDPPRFALSKLVNSLKGVSSRILRRDRRDLRKRYWKGVLWSPSYFASTCGAAPLAIVKQYIEQQRA